MLLNLNDGHGPAARDTRILTSRVVGDSPLNFWREQLTPARLDGIEHAPPPGCRRQTHATRARAAGRS